MTSSVKMENAHVQEGQRLRLHYLDGLRGLAALWVVLHHAVKSIDSVQGWLPDRWVAATKWTGNGQIAVQVFIVLSGYCLMMPVSRSGGLKGGRWEFVKRRARRILPPYYAALAFALAVILFVPGMGVPHGIEWDGALPAITWGVLGSHLLLLQDLGRDWILKINPPMWTISQEWHIYFVFALLLLPMRRYAGILATVLFALLVSVLLRRLPPGHDFYYAAPHFLFLFAIGMLAADMSFAKATDWLALVRDKTPWAFVTTLLWMVYAGLTLKYADQKHFLSMPFTLVAASAMLGSLVLCTKSSKLAGEGNLLLRICEWKPAVILGVFSYSLYLVHAPILAMFTLKLHQLRVPGFVALAFQLCIGVPLAMVFSYGFHLVAERPFMLGHPANLKRTEKAAILDTAP